MQQNGPKDIGFFGTRNMGWMHQQLIEVLSYAMVLTVRLPLLSVVFASQGTPRQADAGPRIAAQQLCGHGGSSDSNGLVLRAQRPEARLRCRELLITISFSALRRGLRLTGCTSAAQGNHIYTSGATGTNAAVIRGALRAEKPDLLTVVLPQSLSMQPPESQELLAEVSTPHMLDVLVLLCRCV